MVMKHNSFSQTVGRSLAIVVAAGMFAGVASAENANAVYSLSSLPAAAQSSISSAIGRDDPAYRAHQQAEAVHTENAMNKFTADFTSAGMDVAGGSAHLHIRLAGYGYGDALNPVADVAPLASSNRVEYHRGWLTEWYVNGPVGLEQGFTISKAPGKAKGQPLTIALTLAGDLTAVVDSERELKLRDRAGKTDLRYTGLSARDASGKDLPARLEMCGERLLLRVNDDGARYPLVIDPWVQLAKLTSSDGEGNDAFGDSVAIDGDTVVVGISAYGRNAAYVFVKPASGWKNMTQTAELTPFRPQTGEFFGAFVAVSGNTIVVSAPDFEGIQKTEDGMVYVFQKPAKGWRNMNETAQLTLPSTANGSRLGWPVVISRNTVVAGAPLQGGVAEVFVRPKNGWRSTSNPNATLQPPSNTQFCTFCLAATANTVVIGTESEGSGGAAYVFVKPASGWRNTANPTATLVASNPSGGLGYSVGIDSTGDTIVAGAPGNNNNAGAVYVFVKPSGGWVSETQTAELTAHNSFGMGLAVSTDGTTVVTGSPNATVGVNQSQGLAYVFVKPASGWKNTAKPNVKVTASDGAQGDQFGTSVALSNGEIVVGAPFANQGEGAAYVFGK
jgi:hypothetical protein